MGRALRRSRNMMTPKENMSCADENSLFLNTSGAQYGSVNPGAYADLAVVQMVSRWYASPKSMILGRYPSQTRMLLRVRSIWTTLQQARKRNPLERCARSVNFPQSDSDSLRSCKWSSRVTVPKWQSMRRACRKAKVGWLQMQYFSRYPLWAELNKRTIFLSCCTFPLWRDDYPRGIFATSAFCRKTGARASPPLASVFAPDVTYAAETAITFKQPPPTGISCATTCSGRSILIQLKTKAFSAALAVLGTGTCSSFSKQQVLQNYRRHSLLFPTSGSSCRPNNFPSPKKNPSPVFPAPNKLLMIFSRWSKVSSVGWRYPLAFQLSPRSQQLKNMCLLTFSRCNVLPESSSSPCFEGALISTRTDTSKLCAALINPLRRASASLVSWECELRRRLLYVILLTKWICPTGSISTVWLSIERVFLLILCIRFTRSSPPASIAVPLRRRTALYTASCCPGVISRVMRKLQGGTEVQKEAEKMIFCW